MCVDCVFSLSVSAKSWPQLTPVDRCLAVYLVFNKVHHSEIFDMQEGEREREREEEVGEGLYTLPLSQQCVSNEILLLINVSVSSCQRGDGVKIDR